MTFGIFQEWMWIKDSRGFWFRENFSWKWLLLLGMDNWKYPLPPINISNWKLALNMVVAKEQQVDLICSGTGKATLETVSILFLWVLKYFFDGRLMKPVVMVELLTAFLCWGTSLLGIHIIPWLFCVNAIWVGQESQASAPERMQGLWMYYLVTGFTFPWFCITSVQETSPCLQKPALCSEHRLNILIPKHLKIQNVWVYHLPHNPSGSSLCYFTLWIIVKCRCTKNMKVLYVDATWMNFMFSSSPVPLCLLTGM